MLHLQPSRDTFLPLQPIGHQVQLLHSFSNPRWPTRPIRIIVINLYGTIGGFNAREWYIDTKRGRFGRFGGTSKAGDSGKLVKQNEKMFHTHSAALFLDERRVGPSGTRFPLEAGNDLGGVSFRSPASALNSLWSETSIRFLLRMFISRTRS